MSGEGAIRLLLALVDDAFDRPAWHGPNLRGALRGLREADAAWRPGARRHNAWEIAVHAAYWKYAVRRKLTGLPRGSFALAGSNWFRRPGGGRSFQDDLALLDSEHRLLREAIEELPPQALSKKARGSKRTVEGLVYGVAAHDVYHAGQIRLLRTLRGGSR